MEFIDLQTILMVMVVLTAAALVVFLDCRKRQRRQPQLAKTGNAARPQRPLMLFTDSPIEFASAKRLAAERPLEPLVASSSVAGAPTVSKTPAAPPAPPPDMDCQTVTRDTVTIQMTASPCQALTVSLPAFTIDAALWERLVSSMPKTNLLTSGDEESNLKPARQRPVPIDVAPGAVDANYQVMSSEPQQRGWPKGMIQQPEFQELLDGGEPFSGLVVSIGVNENDSSMWHSQGLMQSVATYIAGLLREKEFSCRTSYDEFIIVCCGEQGPQSQRRLNHISERLWDYQLRGIGTCSILFSWGGVEVQDQPLAEAVASAVDRMRQTKRAGSPSGLAGAHRKAV